MLLASFDGSELACFSFVSAGFIFFGWVVAGCGKCPWLVCLSLAGLLFGGLYFLQSAAAMVLKVSAAGSCRFDFLVEEF
ncbi:hypothetical protein FH972_006244 [Carpinus fangiana]|uniref:Transmembrane protein n=1 Tax=Carpinus fangiana TaxID=176857 RepID=A0A5N6QUN0_9ROSI|nr:hypothetical protein FH972_006244 [Carpinus fangiana]